MKCHGAINRVIQISRNEKRSTSRKAMRSAAFPKRKRSDEPGPPSTSRKAAVKRAARAGRNRAAARARRRKAPRAAKVPGAKPVLVLPNLQRARSLAVPAQDLLQRRVVPPVRKARGAKADQHRRLQPRVQKALLRDHQRGSKIAATKSPGRF